MRCIRLLKRESSVAEPEGNIPRLLMRTVTLRASPKTVTSLSGETAISTFDQKIMETR